MVAPLDGEEVLRRLGLVEDRVGLGQRGGVGVPVHEHHRCALQLGGVLAVEGDVQQRLDQHRVDPIVVAARVEGVAERHDGTRRVPGDGKVIHIGEVGQLLVDARDHERHVAHLARDVVGELGARPAPHGQRVPGRGNHVAGPGPQLERGRILLRLALLTVVEHDEGKRSVGRWAVGNRLAVRVALGGIPEVGDHGPRVFGGRGPELRGGPRFVDEGHRARSHPVRPGRLDGVVVAARDDADDEHHNGDPTRGHERHVGRVPGGALPQSTQAGVRGRPPLRLGEIPDTRRGASGSVPFS